MIKKKFSPSSGETFFKALMEDIGFETICFFFFFFKKLNEEKFYLWDNGADDDFLS